MKSESTVSLRLLLFFLLAFGIVALTVVFMTTYSRAMREQGIDTLSQVGTAVANSAADLLVDYIIEEDYAGLFEVSQGYADNPLITRAYITDTDGKVLADSSGTELGKTIHHIETIQSTVADGVSSLVRERDLSLLVTRSLVYAGDSYGFVLLEISKTTMLAHQRQLQSRALLLSGVFSCFGFLCSWLIAQWLTRPLEQVCKLAESISMGEEPSVASPTSRILEIRLLAKSVWDMAAKIVKREQALLDERERLTVTLRSIGDGVIATDRDGQVQLMNRAAETMTGWRQEEALGKSIEQVFCIVDGITGETYDDCIQRVLDVGQVVDLAEHTILVSRDSTRRSIADCGSPIRDRNSKVIGVVLVFRDVTELQRVEQDQLKIKKLESLGTLAGGIAHDFNNILAAILGNINLAVLKGALDETTKQYLDAAEKASIRAKGLTTQLLTFAKGGAPVKESAALGDLVRESAQFVLHGSNVDCVYEIPTDLWSVQVDKGQISQVIQNLVINADHAMPMGGTITISCANCSDSEVKAEFPKKSEYYVRMSISDSGIGIPANVLDKIFDPYFSTKQQGSGLGLSICHSIMSRHDGGITVRSMPGFGTTFTLYLPASIERTPEDEAGETVLTEMGKARILVMDDEVIVQDIARDMLSIFGHEVLLASGGEEAVSIFRRRYQSEEPLDLVIMDLTIPGGMGGQEAVQKILAIDPTARVIVSSGYSNDPVMADFQKYGFVGAIVKPYSLDELSQGVADILSSTS